MSEAAVTLRGVGKEFTLGQRRRRQDTLREVVVDAVRSTFARDHQEKAEHLWALRDVSFDVREGEVFGVIGRNGSGKSTLLKILSRITEPTTGEIVIRGRVGALLEVGTGFHSELTGRENILLNGAILGMTRTELARKFDEIVGFAEVEQFIDTPVKHYSSGMYLRLGFAVAAHLEPDILIVDEVLAVGDEEFQKKCLGRMSAVAREGRTVIFVSHNLDAVQRLCSQCVLLGHGRVEAQGDTAEVVSRYLSDRLVHTAPDTVIDLENVARLGSGKAKFRSARYSSGVQKVAHCLYPGGPLRVVLEIDTAGDRLAASFGVTVRTMDGRTLVVCDGRSLGHNGNVYLKSPTTTLEVCIEALYLNPGNYMIALWAGDGRSETYDYIQDAFEIEVTAGPRRYAGPRTVGLVPCEFTVTHLDARPHASLSTPAERSSL